MEALAEHVQPLACELWRVIETQEVAATRAITDTAAEQSRLEELLEQTKPSLADDCQGLSYLLFTPFRYPPLDYGSRFGSTFERGIFYASMELETAFAETAAYLWLFQSALETLGPVEFISDQRTAICAAVASERGVDFSNQHFQAIRHRISAADSWQYSQQLGSQCRELDLEVLLYTSARCVNGTNAAVLSPAAFSKPEPIEQQHWYLKLDKDRCWFGRYREGVEFLRADFEIEGRIPHPAL